MKYGVTMWITFKWLRIMSNSRLWY